MQEWDSPGAADRQELEGAGGDTAGQGPPVVLTIAGLDPSAGAGVTADLKVFAAHRLYGVTAVTALTVQSTVGVRRVEAVSAELLRETLGCLAEDLPIAGVKIGMLGTALLVRAVAEFLDALRGALPRAIPVVLDPVLRSSSGHELLEGEGLAWLRTRLLPLVDCVTPNTAELALLAGEALATPATGRGDVERMAGLLAEQQGALAIVATGGQLGSPDDYVVVPGQRPGWLPGQWVQTTATHGTGCAHSSALLCGLVAGLSVYQAAAAAKGYVTEALRQATPMGTGGGSMQHLYTAFSSEQLRACRLESPEGEADAAER